MNGNDAKQAIAYMLYLAEKDGGANSSCGAFMISRSRAITAAHCVKAVSSLTSPFDGDQLK